MQNHDKIIINTIYQDKLPKAKYLKNSERYPNITEYLFTRFEYIDSLKESLDRIKYNKEIRPICKECGNKVKYLGLNKGHLLYQSFCCSKCSNSNKLKQQKTKETCLKRYGVDNPWKNEVIKEKCNKSKVLNCQLKYGVDNVMQIDEVKQKSIETQHNTNKLKYGVNSVFSIPEIHKKCEKQYKETCLKKYGVDNYSKTDEFIDKIKKTNQKRYGVDFSWQYDGIKEKIKYSYKETCLKKYGVDNYSKTDEFIDKIKKTNQERYGVDFSWQAHFVREKIYGAKLTNCTFNTSIPEESLYKILCVKYGSSDIIRQYKCERYPFNCDFYIKSLDTFIELQGMWTHGPHPYNPNSIKDQVKLQRWQSKANNGSRFYKNAIKVWTISDPNKRKIAKENHLNYIEVFDSNFEILYNLSIL